MGKDLDEQPWVTAGPLISRSIFANKWAYKSCNLITRRSEVIENATDPVSMGICVVDGFDHLTEFALQAVMHSLSVGDFLPSEYASTSYYETITNPERATQNPFMIQWQVMVLVDGFIQRLMEMKLHGRSLLGVPWQAIPLLLRDKLNEIFVWVEQARKEPGLWPVTDEHREMMSKIKRDEEQSVL